jgi:hypothetical protein
MISSIESEIGQRERGGGCESRRSSEERERKSTHTPVIYYGGRNTPDFPIFIIISTEMLRGGGERAEDDAIGRPTHSCAGGPATALYRLGDMTVQW